MPSAKEAKTGGRAFAWQHERPLPFCPGGRSPLAGSYLRHQRPAPSVTFVTIGLLRSRERGLDIVETPMKRKTSRPVSPARKKLLDAIALAEKQADAAKKHAKLVKLTLKNAKQKYKDARKAAKKARKAAQKLKKELAAIARRRKSAKKRAAKLAPKPALPKSMPSNTRKSAAAPTKVAQRVAVAPVKVEIPGNRPESAPPAPAQEVPKV